MELGWTFAIAGVIPFMLCYVKAFLFHFMKKHVCIQKSHQLFLSEAEFCSVEK